MIAGFHLARGGWGGGSCFDRHFPVWFLKGLQVNFYFGGTSLLIVVGVAMDTVQQLEAQLVMRNYEGFARKGRVRGRRQRERTGVAPDTRHPDELDRAVICLGPPRAGKGTPAMELA